MLQKPQTDREKRAVQFAVDLITKYGYGCTIHQSTRRMAQTLWDKGKNMFYLTIHNYWKALEKIGYVTSEMSSRAGGKRYTLNRYALSKHLVER